MLVPFDSLSQSVYKRSLNQKTELARGAGNIEATSGLAVRLGCVPYEFAFKPRQFAQQFRQFPDGDLVP